jgi:hypothetical protein
MCKVTHILYMYLLEKLQILRGEEVQIDTVCNYTLMEFDALAFGRYTQKQESTLDISQ